MRNRPEFVRGVFCGMLVTIAATSFHWFITPASHPDASTLRSIGVAAQAVVCLALAWWLARAPRSIA